MKSQTQVTIIIALWLGTCSGVTFGHEVRVHQEITKHAAASASTYSSAYGSFLNTISFDCAKEKAESSMIEGSAKEDDPTGFFPTDEGGYRSVNHFYDPLTGLGLSNIPPDDRPTSGTLGIDSFTWASKKNSPGKLGAYNTWSWQNARDIEWLSLTSAYPSARRDALVKMFRAVGQVVHLLEDTSQPQHVRNEQHLLPVWRSPIEKYGKEHLNDLIYTPGMLPWKADGFTKMEDFWDRAKYNKDEGSSALVADAGATGVSAVRLGLAEYSNGNFLGAHHLFPEYYNPQWVQYYPFPSRDHSTDYNDVKANPAAHITNLGTIEGIPVTGNGIYLKKTGDGVTYDHIARVNYLGAKLPNADLKGTPYCTIKDDNVLYDYHYKLIPKAVEYSAGLLDYFFRGTLGVKIVGYTEAPYDMQPGLFQLQITNTSSQTFHGGAFYLFADDKDWLRTEIPMTTDYSGNLATNGTINAFFDPPSGSLTNLTKYLMVFRGDIGVEGSTALDPVDQGIAIATKSFGTRPDWSQLVWQDAVYYLGRSQPPPVPGEVARFNLWNSGNLVFSQDFANNTSWLPNGWQKMTINTPGDEFQIELAYVDDVGGDFAFSNYHWYNPPWIALPEPKTAKLTYNGSGWPCNVHISASTDEIYGGIYVGIYSDGNLLVDAEVWAVSGEFDFPFAVPDTQGEDATITVEVVAVPANDGGSVGWVNARVKITNY